MDAGETTNLTLVVLAAVTRPGGPEEMVSVWVDTLDEDLARQRAIGALKEEGWLPGQVSAVMLTSEADYFRPCESRQAFERARRNGIAWRLASST